MSTSRTPLFLRRYVAAIGMAACALWAVSPAHAQTPRVPAPAALAAKGTINYCATIDNPPRAYFDEKQQPIGFEVDLGVEIARSTGYNSSFLVWSLLCRHSSAMRSCKSFSLGPSV